MIRPILKWAGGKSRPLNSLKEHFPKKFSRYIEPFLGGGAVFFGMPEVKAIINDANPELISLYEVVRDEPEKLMKELEKLRKIYSEKMFYKLRATLPKGKVQQAARTIFLNKTGFNGLYRLNSKGEFNVPFGKRPKCPALYDPKNIVAVSKRLRSAVLLNSDFEEIIDKAKRGDFIYCDPPYQPLSKTASFTSYTPTGFSLAEQKRLKAACERAVKRGAFVAISNSSARSMLALYRGWPVKKIPVKRVINSKGGSRGALSEILVSMKRFNA